MPVNEIISMVHIGKSLHTYFPSSNGSIFINISSIRFISLSNFNVLPLQYVAPYSILFSLYLHAGEFYLSFLKHVYESIS